MKKLCHYFLFASVLLAQTACEKNAFKDENAELTAANRSIAKGKGFLDLQADSLKNQTIFINKSVKDVRLGASRTQQEIVKKITEIVQPVVEQVGKLMKAQPDLYRAYEADIKAISAAKTTDEKQSKIAYVSKTYYPFVKKIWTDATIDEPYYQAKIRDVFPESIRKSIKFSEFLRFQYEVNQPVQPYKPFSGTGSQSPDTPPDYNKPDPDPDPYRCMDDIPTSFFLFDTYKSGIGTGSHSSVIDQTNQGTFHSGISTKTDTQGPWGSRAEAGITLDSLRIPGRFPLDSRHLQSTLEYDWGGSSYATSVLGTSLATYYETPFYDDNWDNWAVVRTICSPVTFVMFSKLDQDGTFTSPQAVKQAGNWMFFGYGTANLSSASGIAFAGALTYAETLKWQVCETP